VKRTLAVAVLALAASTAWGTEIFRCTAAGAITYQQQPCGPAATGGAVDIPTTYPDPGPERERLLQREAALDARLMKRLEIESAERIARDQRIARERELQFERERADRERSQEAPVYIVNRFPGRRGALGAPRIRPTW
jgi:hypothetical protein